MKFKRKYIIHKEPLKDKINHGDSLRIDLYGDSSIKDVRELEGFSFIYITKGHNEIDKKIRYIKVFRKEVKASC